jgi:hypothetical protein
MKNLFDSGGMPVGAANHDVKTEMKKLALESYGKGLDASMDCMKQAIEQAASKGHETIPLSDLLVLIEELRVIAKKGLL